MTVPTVHNPGELSQQVFKTVPTQDEMHLLEDRLRQVQGARLRLLIITVFLAGIVIAGAVAVSFFYRDAINKVNAAEAAVQAQQSAFQQKDRQIVALNAAITNKDEIIASYADFQSISALEAQINELEADIAALLAQPSRANAPASLKKLPEPVEWFDGAVTVLRTRRDALQETKRKVEAWPPAMENPRPD